MLVSVVPFGKFVAHTLREWKLACPKGHLDLVFPNGVGKIESLANIINRGLVPAQVAAGVVVEGRAKYTGLHSLRHFYASWCINRPAGGGAWATAQDRARTAWPLKHYHDL
jgi:integrase